MVNNFEQILKFGYYLIGFFIYLLFSLLTFKFYSKKKEMTKEFILILIFFFYSILAIYLIFGLEVNSIFIEKLVYSIIFLIFGAFFLKNYYFKYIKNEDDKLYGENI